MVWPIDDLTAVHLDSGTDDPKQARPELLAHINKFKTVLGDPAITEVATIAALKALATPASAIAVNVQGYLVRGDGGGGIFWWDSASATADNGGTIISPDSAPASGRWKRLYSGPANVRWFGAKGDGVTNDVSAFSSAISTAKEVYMPPGNYLLGGGLTLPLSQRFFGAGRESRITYTGTGALFTASGNYPIIDDLFIVLEGNNQIGLDLANFSYAGSRNMHINGRKAEGMTGQIGIKITGDATGGYWNRFIKSIIDNIATGVSLNDDANSNDFVSCVVRRTNIAYKLTGQTTSGFHCVNNHIIGGSIDTFDVAGFDITDADYTIVESVYIESLVAGAVPWRVNAGASTTNNSFINEFNNVALGPTDNGAGTVRFGPATGLRSAQIRASNIYIGLADGDPKILKGSGSPEGVLTENKGSFYVDVGANGSTNQPILYQKGTSTGNTGWIPYRAVREDAGGTPEGRLTMEKGTLFVDTSAAAKVYIKTSTGGNTGWVVVGTQT